MNSTASESLSFEQSLIELEKIVHDLEDGKIGLEESLTRYEQGVGLLKQCYGKLRQAETKIQELIGTDGQGNVLTKPFDHSASLENARIMSMFDLANYLRDKQRVTEDLLNLLLRQESASPPVLVEAMHYSLLAPGKRLRPALVFMGCQAAGGTDEQAWPAACAVEMIHTYSLIHDDLPAMDDDDLRRGLPTCHKKFGEALAILAGDALLTMAFQVLTEQYPAAIAAGCCRELAVGAGAAGMVGGQVEDLAWERDTAQGPAASREKVLPRSEQPHSLPVLESIHGMKTGALFRACLKMGVWATQGNRPEGPSEQLLVALDQYGRRFGLIFQITDDLLDVESSAEETGKRTGKDAARGKLTYPGLLGVEESRAKAKLLADEAIDAVGFLGEAALPLVRLVEFLLTRKR